MEIACGAAGTAAALRRFSQGASPMMKPLIAAAATLSLVSCIKQDDIPSDIDHAIPTAEQVSINLPQGQTRSIGQLATWYVATRDVTRTFNGASAWVLIVIHTIVQFPVTSVHGDTYTWGPWSGALDPAEYKLDVRAIGDGTYGYQLSGRSKTVAGAKFEVVIDGTADPRAGEAKGSGEFLIDFDASKRVNPVDSADARGTVDAHYDLAQAHLDLTIMSTDALGKPVLADYAYNETAEGGNMTFSVSADAGGGPLPENVTLRSRWLTTGTQIGAGRADARLAGGDLGALQATASECWDTMFRRVFYTDSVNLTSTEGSASACAFATADLPAPK
jgi:hypothetical protein